MRRNPILALIVVLTVVVLGIIGLSFAGWKLRRRKE
jgi:hypothetical protein